MNAAGKNYEFGPCILHSGVRMQLGKTMSLVLSYCILVYKCSWESPKSGTCKLHFGVCMQLGTALSLALTYCILVCECSWEESKVRSLNTACWRINEVGNIPESGPFILTAL
jgi:hypothetical protein